MLVAMASANGAGDPGKAATASAAIRWRRQVIKTCCKVITISGKGADRTARQAGTIPARVAWPASVSRLTSNDVIQFEGVIDQECCAKSEPKTEFRMDRKPDRRGKEHAGSLGPLHEWVIGRALEGIERLETEICRDRIDGLHRPLVEREIRSFSPSSIIVRPDSRTDIADDRDCIRLFSPVGQQMFAFIGFERTKQFQTVVT